MAQQLCGYTETHIYTKHYKPHISVHKVVERSHLRMIFYEHSDTLKQTSSPPSWVLLKAIKPWNVQKSNCWIIIFHRRPSVMPAPTHVSGFHVYEKRHAGTSLGDILAICVNIADYNTLFFWPHSRTQACALTKWRNSTGGMAGGASMYVFTAILKQKQVFRHTFPPNFLSVTGVLS